MLAPTSMTVPTSSSWTSLRKLAIWFLSMPAISSALIMAIPSWWSVRSGVGHQVAGEFVEPAGDRAVDAAIAHHDPHAPEERGVDATRDLERLGIDVLEPRDQRGQFVRPELARALNLERVAAGFGQLELVVLDDDRREQRLAPLAHEQQQRVQDDLVDRAAERLGDDVGLLRAIDDRRYEEAARVRVAADRVGGGVQAAADRVDAAGVLREGEDRHGVAACDGLVL